MSAPPDILVFLTDDHAAWAMPPEAGGAPGAVEAPTLAALAAGGLVMTRAVSPCPVCSPARASLLTGLMPSQHGVRDFIAAAPAFHRRDWLQGLDTLPQQLRRAGYRCGLSGKWHLGRDEVPAPGFDAWHALSGAYPVTHDGRQEISHNGVLAEHAGHLTDAITEGALEILASAPADQPLFLLVGYYATHSPWQGQPADLVATARARLWQPETGPLPEGYGLTNPERPPPGHEEEALVQYRAAVAHIDAGVARILAARRGRDTLVVYTADHGLALGQGGIWGKGNATRPQNLFDTSIRIPMILSRPGHLSAAARSDRFFDLCDLYALLRQAAGLEGAERDGLRRPGRLPGAEKPLQVCEYGPLARALTGDASLEVRAPVRPTGPLGAALARFYADLDCPPPWDWQPSPDPCFNTAQAWTLC